MSTKNITLIIGIILILGIGGFVYSQKDNDIKVSTPLTNTVIDKTVGTECEDGEVDCISNNNEPSEYDDIKAGTSGTSNNTTPAKTTPNTTGVTLKTYTSADVSSHNSKTSCWSIINGSVYDLTSWVPQHPGGERAILSICGVDGSANFNGQHGGSSKIASILAGFKIGIAK